jgi:type III secretory pathway component EscS
MSPSAEPANPAATDAALVPEGLLNEGEVILLAIRPSPWFVAIVSLPVLLLAALAPAMLGVLDALTDRELQIGRQAVWLAASVLAVGRLLVAGVQWSGRLYVLTNRRVLRLTGVTRPDVQHCPLRRIVGTRLAVTSPERVSGTASVLFDTTDDVSCDVTWLHVSRPREVQETIERARRNVR